MILLTDPFQADIDIHRFQIGLEQAGHRALHRRGFGKRGGLWNRAWSDFFGSGHYKDAGNKQEAILKFGAQMLQYFVGF